MFYKKGTIHQLLQETPCGVFELMTETQIVAAEVERVEKKLPMMFEIEDTFYGQIEKASAALPVSNRAMRVPMKLRPGGQGGHYNPDGGSLGLGDGPDFDKAVITIQHLRWNMQWTKLTEYATDSDRKSVVNAYQDLLASAMPEFRRMINCLCMTAGNGVLATVTTVSSSAGTDTIVCSTDGYGVKLLRPKQPVKIYDSTLATDRTAAGAVKISYYDIPSKTIKLPSVSGTTAGDKIVIDGVAGASPTSLLGVPYHNSNASTGTWLGYDRSATPEIRANRVAAGGALALPFPRLAINKIGDRLGMKQLGKTLKAKMHPCQKQAYEGLGQLVSIIQKTAKDENLDLYFGDGMQMAGAAVDEDFMWDKTRIDFLPMDSFYRAEMKAASFHEVGGRKIFELRGGDGSVTTSQIQHLVVGMNIGNYCPPSLSYIDTLTVPSGY